jgi:ABC-2 type transport system ATP-binding protein
MIEVAGLAKRFGKVEAVRALSFDVADGEIFGLLGPNGAGKTTTVRILAGLIGATEGTAVINGHRLGDDSQRIRAITGVLTESPGLHDRLTARENLAFYGRLYGLGGRTLRDAVTRYLEIVGLSDAADRRVGGFSKGMRQKVAIARAMLHEPEVIYLDEPTSGLDPSAAKTVRDFVETLRERGRSIVICTHNLDEAERLCDRVGIMHGTLLNVDTPSALRRHGRAATVRVELAGPRQPESFIDVVAGLPFVAGCRTEHAALLVEMSDPRGDNPDLVRALVEAGARITAVHEEAASLEDVYLDYVADRTADGNGDAATPARPAAVV